MQHREEEISKAKIEIVKIFTSIFDQEMKMKAKQMLQSDMNSMLDNMKEKFPMLLKTLKENKGTLLNERGKVLTRIKVNLGVKFSHKTLRRRLTNSLMKNLSRKSR